MVRLVLIMLPFCLATAFAWGVPGAAPIGLCREGEPEYTREELDQIRLYRDCVQVDADHREGNAAADRCSRLVREVAADRLVAAGSTPEWQHYPLRHIVNECSQKTDPYRGKAGRYSCRELARRYPEIVPLIKVCREIDSARARDRRRFQETETRCQVRFASGHALAEECRRVVYVVPPQVPVPHLPAPRQGD